MDNTLIELSLREVLGLAFLVILLVIPIGISRIPQNGDSENIPPLLELQRHVGLKKINTGLFLVALLFWGVVFAILFLGLVTVIWQLIFAQHSDITTPNELWSWRFSLVKLTALTATLGAVVALPFTLIRLTHSRRQTRTAIDALFNNKIDAAVSDLHAQRQVTKWLRSGVQNGWEDDVTRRNGAISRLEVLAEQEPSSARRIARMLSIYVRAVSRELPAKTAPQTLARKQISLRQGMLLPVRSDVQSAVQVLGRMRNGSGLVLEGRDIDLRGADLRGCDLSNLNLSRALLRDTRLEGANLSSTKLVGAYLARASFNINTDFTKTDFLGAAVAEVDFTDTSITPEQLAEMFGDGSVTLSNGHGAGHKSWPQHWVKEELKYADFEPKWRAFQVSIGYDPDAPR